MASVNRSVHRRSIKAPERSSIVLVALILVAGVANLNLAVANVALPDIGQAFDSSQTVLNLIAVGLLARPGGVGAVPRGARRSLRPQVDAGLRHRPLHPGLPARCLGALDDVLVVARILGGLAAGMAYPTTLALITALWSGPGRTKAIALWSGIGGAFSALGPLDRGLPARALLVGVGLPGDAAPRAPSGWCWPSCSSPLTSTRPPIRSTTSAASCRCVLVGSLDPGDQLRRGPRQGGARPRPRHHRPGGARRVRAPATPGPQPALRPAHRRPAHLLGRRLRRHHRVRLAHGRHVHRPAVPAERARLLARSNRARRSCPRRSSWS